MTEAARAATQRVRICVLACVALLATACGKVTHNPRHSAQAGETNGGVGDMGPDTGGGANASDVNGEDGEGGEGGTARARAAAQADACIAYALAVCRRQAACSHSADENCVNTVTLECPDLVFSSGATRSVEDLVACAKVYETVSCDDVRYNVLPPCVTPGTRAPGEACAFPSQCKSLDCKMAGDCGSCATEAATGESCAAPDADCDSYTFCGASQTCVSLSGPVYPPNEACTLDYPCWSDTYCDGVCRPLPNIGESCAETAACVGGAYCGAGALCFPIPGSGDPCGVVSGDDGRPSAVYCGAGSACSFDASGASGTCLPLPEVGEPCFFTAGLPNARACAYDLHCNDSVDPPLCARVAARGEACHELYDCERGLVCACPPDEPSCEHKSCREVRFDAERCDEPNVACHPAFRCKGGICLARGMQSIFAGACGE